MTDKVSKLKTDVKSSFKSKAANLKAIIAANQDETRQQNKNLQDDIEQKMYEYHDSLKEQKSPKILKDLVSSYRNI